MKNYYVFRFNGEVRRIARITDNWDACGWENGKWVSMPGLLKIQHDITDYEDITEEEAMKLVADQTVKFLLEKWKKELVPKKKEWDKKPGWPAKLVETTFVLNGKEYSIKAPDLGLTDDCWDQGFMETIQGDMKKDLEELGAEDIYSMGFID